MGRGRPSKLTPQVQRKLVNAIRAGNYYEAACGYAGIDYSTFRRWILKGQQARKGKYRDFYEAIVRAEQEAEVRMVAQWQRHMPTDYRAIRDFLERRFPERWGRRQIDLAVQQEVRGQVNVKHDGGVTLDLATDEEFLRAIQAAVAGRTTTGDMDGVPGSVDSGDDGRGAMGEASRDSAGSCGEQEGRSSKRERDW